MTYRRLELIQRRDGERVLKSGRGDSLFKQMEASMYPTSLGWSIATNNVAQFRRQLKAPADEKQRKVLEFLLRRELKQLGVQEELA